MSRTPSHTMTIGQRIRMLRSERGLSQLQLAQAVGLTQAAISNLETDSSRKPSASTLLRLAAVLRCNADWVLTGHGNHQEDQSIHPHDEVELIALFRAMTPTSRRAILAAARALHLG